MAIMWSLMNVIFLILFMDESSSDCAVIGENNGDIISIDLSTGHGVKIGSSRVRMDSFAIDRTTNTIYGISYNVALYKINQCANINSSASLITKLYPIPPDGVGGVGLGFNKTDKNILYTSGYGTAGNLYRMNLTNGDTEKLGYVGGWMYNLVLSKDSKKIYVWISHRNQLFEVTNYDSLQPVVTFPYTRNYQSIEWLNKNNETDLLACDDIEKYNYYSTLTKLDLIDKTQTIYISTDMTFDCLSMVIFYGVDCNHLPCPYI